VISLDTYPHMPLTWTAERSAHCANLFVLASLAMVFVSARKGSWWSPAFSLGDPEPERSHPSDLAHTYRGEVGAV
jgi:hypothetical protein